MKKRLLIQTIAYCFVIASMADDASHLFRKQATAQTAGFLACRNPAAEVTVQVLQRPIEITGETGRSVNENLVHYQVVVREGGSNGEIIENYGWASANEYTVGVVISDPGKVYVDPDMTRYDSIPVAEIKTTWREHYEAKKQWESRAQKTRYSMNPLKQSDFVEHCQNSAKWAFEAEMARPGAVVTKEFHFPGEGHTVNIDAAQVPTLETMQTDSGMVNLTFANETAQNTVETDSGILNKDVLDSLMKFGETLEEGFEFREDLRADRRERKAREQAERERKAAEEELRRQQQPAEQRKKAQSDQKKTNTKTQKKSSGTKPSKTEPTPQPGKPSNAADTIDFSHLNSLISQQVSFLRGIISSGQKATSAQHSQFNSLNNQYVSEFNRLKAQIGNISDPTIRNQYYSQLASINSRISSEVDPLLAQGQSRGLFKNL